MSAVKLKEWMKANSKTTVDVASITKVSPKTVDRYLDGETVRPVVEAAFERLVTESPRGDGPPKAA